MAFGFLAGYADWEASTGRTDLEESGESIGILGRFTTSLDESVFVGLQASFTPFEGAAWHWQGRVGDACATLEGENRLECRCLGADRDTAGRRDRLRGSRRCARAGIHGRQHGGVRRCAAGQRIGFAHGYKLAAGLEFPVGERVGVFVQMDYADYGEVMYGDIPIALTATGLGLGGIYRF